MEQSWVGRGVGAEARGNDDHPGIDRGVVAGDDDCHDDVGHPTRADAGGRGTSVADRQAGRPKSARPRGRRRYEKLRQDPLVYALVTRLARSHRISLADVMQDGRGSGCASHTRQMAMYLCYVLLRRTQEQLGELFNRDRKTISHACAHIELLRETDRALDRELCAFEAEGWVEAAGREAGLPRDAA